MILWTQGTELATEPPRPTYKAYCGDVNNDCHVSGVTSGGDAWLVMIMMVDDDIRTINTLRMSCIVFPVSFVTFSLLKVLK